MRLAKEFYLNDNVIQVAKELLGKFLCTNINGRFTSGMIIETEAYSGINDKASHAYNNRRTSRTETMFKKGGVAYIYLCYGIHHLFNVVTSQSNIPHAVLIRSLVPIEGIDTMKKRRDKDIFDKLLTSGPGSLSKALSITTKFDGVELTGNKIWIEGRGVKFDDSDIIITPRIGVDYAQEDALLAYRFLLK